MSSTIIQDTSDMESENGEAPEPPQKKSKSKLPKAPKDGVAKTIKKKISTPRATPRPYKNLPMERLSSTINTLKERVEVTDNRLQTYSIRLRKLNAELEIRTKEHCRAD